MKIKSISFLVLVFFLLVSCSDTPCEETIVYPENTSRGLNALEPTITEIDSLEQYSFSVEKEKNCPDLKYILKGQSCGNNFCWAIETSNNLNWRIDPPSSNKTQVLYATGEKNDVSIFFDSGVFTIEYYEDGSDVISRTKTLIVN